MSEVRQRQDAYSESESHVLVRDEGSRRKKAAKIAAVVEHFLGRTDLVGLRVLDVGCSRGIVADELARRGATVTGVDIDVPGVANAARTFPESVSFLVADSETLPIATSSIDVVICNQVYEHVLSPERLMDELRRVTRVGGLMYLALGNRMRVMEPHYHLPFLSWLPRSLAHRYVRVTKKGCHYHERSATRRGLQHLCRNLTVWDYTFTVLGDPERFEADDVARGPITKVPPKVLRLGRPLVPTYLWVATVEPSRPAGPPTRTPPERVAT